MCSKWCRAVWAGKMGSCWVCGSESVRLLLGVHSSRELKDVCNPHAVTPIGLVLCIFNAQCMSSYMCILPIM